MSISSSSLRKVLAVTAERLCKEHPAEQVGEGEEEEGDPVAKPGSKLRGKENPKEDSEPED